LRLLAGGLGPASDSRGSSGKRLFLIFDHRTAHPLVYLSAAVGVREAIEGYLLEFDPELQLIANGALVEGTGRYAVTYPHPLAYIEAHHKPHGEWQIRELPADACRAPLTEAFCGEDESDVAVHLAACREVLRRDHPGSRASGFVWYLQDGVLVTFYRRKRGGITVLQRYVRFWRDDTGYHPWGGDYEQLLSSLYLGPKTIAPPAA
jgi:hypothetical protein